ncbi:MAG: pilus assembly protein TadG-related protein [Stagnimonas sp.]|nr:pilus assembly protein TadG-related protein [Stagnimonas sp.]
MTTSPRCPPPSSSRQRQRGVAAVFAAITLIALIGFMAVAIDVGRLYYAQRELQRLANIGALDASRVVSGCGTDTGVPGTQSQALAELTASLGRNVDSLDGLSRSIEIGRDVELADDNAGLRGFETLAEGDEKLNAVRVTLSRAAPTRLLPAIADVGDTISAVAVASQRAVGAFTVGSSTLTLNSRESELLNPLLEGLLCPTGTAGCEAGINLSVADYNGLAAANLSLGNLIAGASAVGLDVDNLSELLALELTVPQWLNVVGAALEFAVDASGSQVSADIAALVTGLAGIAEPGSTVSLASLLNTTSLALSGPLDTVLTNVPFVDAGSLLTGLGQAAALGTPIEVQGLGLDVPGVASVKAWLVVGAPPKYAIGPAGSEGAKASTQQVDLKVRIAAGAVLAGLKTAIEGALNGLLSLLGSLVGLTTTVAVLPSDINLGVDVKVAAATASLDELSCPTRANGNEGMPTAGLSTSATGAEIDVGTFSSGATAPATLSGSSSLPLATVAVDASCVGVKLGSLCLGLNLGTTTVALGLEMTSVDVASLPNTALNDVTSYTQDSSTPPLRYLASNPVADMNPQTLGAPVSASVSLGLTSVTTGGTGLTGLLTSLISDLINSLNTVVLAPLLAVVNTLGAELIDPLLGLLGIQLGSSTVTMIGVGVDQPHLITTDYPEAAD